MGKLKLLAPFVVLALGSSGAMSSVAHAQVADEPELPEEEPLSDQVDDDVSRSLDEDITPEERSGTADAPTSDGEPTSKKETSSGSSGAAPGQLAEIDPNDPALHATRDKSQAWNPGALSKLESPGEGDRRTQEKPATRWSEFGAVVGMVVRSSSDPRFKYQPGITYGGYFRPQITDFLAVRLGYREERIHVTAQPGAYDYDGQHQSPDLQQPPLKVTNLSVRIEPSYSITSYLHIVGALAWSWVRWVAPMPQSADFKQRANRAAVELNWGLGGGVSIDILPRWINFSAMGTYYFVTNQTGSAYSPIQAVVDGQVTHFGPMARPKNCVDLLFTLGLIL